MRKIQSENLKIMMDNRQIIGKLRECAKGLLDVARELQRAERVESPRTLEIVKRQVKARVGKAHEFALPFVVGVDDFGDDGDCSRAGRVCVR